MCFPCILTYMFSSYIIKYSHGRPRRPIMQFAFLCTRIDFGPAIAKYKWQSYLPMYKPLELREGPLTHRQVTSSAIHHPPLCLAGPHMLSPTRKLHSTHRPVCHNVKSRHFMRKEMLIVFCCVIWTTSWVRCRAMNMLACTLPWRIDLVEAENSQKNSLIHFLI